MQRLEDGFTFIEEWVLELKMSGEFDNGVECKNFLSWQVNAELVKCLCARACKCHCFIDLDLLRVMVYGFKGLVADFLSSHPGDYINPMRINGSAVETLFSQLKHTSHHFVFPESFP